MEQQEDRQLTIWQVYFGAKSPNARRFLVQCATNPLSTYRELLRECGLTGSDDSNHGTHHHWGQIYPGFDTLAERLRDEPIVASNFLANLYLPKALAYMGGVLDGTITGTPKGEAARFIINASGVSRNAAAKGAAKKTPSGGIGHPNDANPLDELLRDEK